MAFGFQQSSYDAVLFIEDEQIVKEMLYSEFEAVLDGIVGEPEHSGKTCTAVYLKIDTALNILAAVFFTIDFDRDGAADKHWNLPLMQLAETAAFGIELNGVSVRVACSSQCQIPWHQEHLWEPDLSSTSNTFKILDRSIKQNKLGLVVDKVKLKSGKASAKSASENESSARVEENEQGDPLYSDAMSGVAEALEADDETRLKMARNLKKLRVHIANLKTRHQQELDTLRSELNHEKEALVEKIEKAQTAREKSEFNAQQLQVEIEHLEAKMQEQKIAHEKQISENLNKQGMDYAELRKQFRQDLQQKLIAQTAELRDKLEMREVELHYREDQIELLNNELKELKSQFLDTREAGPHNEVKELLDKGVLFVVSLPAVGPLNIPAQDLTQYSYDPEAYLAERLKISKALYKQWAEYASNPTCNIASGGNCCNEPLEIVLPHDFVPGVSDRCSLHQGNIEHAANG